MTIAGDGVNLLIRLMCDSPSDCGPGRFGVSYPRKRSLERCKGGPNPGKSPLFACSSQLVTAGWPRPAARSRCGAIALLRRVTSSGTKPRGLFRAACCIAGAIGMGAGPGKLAAVDDQVLLPDRAAVEPALEDFANAGGIPGLGRKARAGVVWSHAVMRHRPPGMILRGGLGKPDVACVARELSALARPRDRISIADFAARSVHDVRAALHLADQLVVEEVLGLRMQRRIDRHHVAHTNQRLDVRVVRDAQLLLDLGRKSVLVGVVQPNFERL